jgi:hypothetical protein
MPNLMCRGSSRVNLEERNNQDPVRGPLNEGGMYAERQEYHYPSPPTSTWELSNPVIDGRWLIARRCRILCCILPAEHPRWMGCPNERYFQQLTPQ